MRIGGRLSKLTVDHILVGHFSLNQPCMLTNVNPGFEWLISCKRYTNKKSFKLVIR